MCLPWNGVKSDLWWGEVGHTVSTFKWRAHLQPKWQSWSKVWPTSTVTSVQSSHAIWMYRRRIQPTYPISHHASGLRFWIRRSAVAGTSLMHALSEHDVDDLWRLWMIGQLKYTHSVVESIAEKSVWISLPLLTILVNWLPVIEVDRWCREVIDNDCHAFKMFNWSRISKRKILLLLSWRH